MCFGYGQSALFALFGQSYTVSQSSDSQYSHSLPVDSQYTWAAQKRSIFISLRYTQVLAQPGKWDVRSKFGLLYSLGELAQCRVYDNVPSGLVSLAEDVPIR